MTANANEPTWPKLMGVLNVTPDSFSDGGKFFSAAEPSAAAALAHAAEMIAAGSTIIDVGGESTRPGAVRLSPAEEQARAIGIVAAIAGLPQVASGEVRISIDTMNASTAAMAVAAGATIINDVSGGAADAEMFRVAASTGSTYVLGHWHDFAAGAGAVQVSQDIVADVSAQLAASLARAEAAGVAREQIVLDPGLGFGKNSAQNWQLVAGLEALCGLGLPLLVGASRKRFIAEKLATEAGCDPSEIGFEARDAATAKLGAELFERFGLSGLDGFLWGLRVHNVKLNCEAIREVVARGFAR